MSKVKPVRAWANTMNDEIDTDFIWRHKASKNYEPVIILLESDYRELLRQAKAAKKKGKVGRGKD